MRTPGHPIVIMGKDDERDVDLPPQGQFEAPFCHLYWQMDWKIYLNVHVKKEAIFRGEGDIVA